jgi:hypothetical protein
VGTVDGNPDLLLREGKRKEKARLFSKKDPFGSRFLFSQTPLSVLCMYINPHVSVGGVHQRSAGWWFDVQVQNVACCVCFLLFDKFWPRFPLTFQHGTKLMTTPTRPWPPASWLSASPRRGTAGGSARSPHPRCEHGGQRACSREHQS